MVTGTWMDNDGLYRRYGTSKAVPGKAGDYQMLGANRVVEIYLDLTTLNTSTATIIDDNTFFGPGPNSSNTWFIEKVELVVETGATGSSSTLDVGLIQADRSTVPSGYGQALIAAEVLAQIDTAGTTLEYFAVADSLPAGSTKYGSLIGSTPSSTTGPYYFTAKAGTAVFTAGVVRIRVYYHGTGTITQ